jgi:hypothetical protein
MPRIRDEFLDCVVYLYPSESDAETGAKIGGSGFLVGVMTAGLSRNFPFLYVVTNKHLIEGGSTTIRMKTKDGHNAIIPTDERAWVFHPAGDDLAIYQIFFDPRNYTFNYVDRALFINKDIVQAMNIGPGDEAFVVGRFINHEGRQQNLPTVRFGCISQMPREPVMQKSGFEQESFLVEARSSGGYSGSPVFAFIPAAGERHGVEDWVPRKIFQSHGPWLLGIDWGHINDWEPIRNAVGEPINPGRPNDMQIRMNTGLMAVVPSWKLAELLDHGPVVSQRRIFTEQVRDHIAAAEPPPTTSD